MIKSAKKILQKILMKFNFYSLYQLHKDSHLKKMGWFESFKNQLSINDKFEPIPWWSYSATYFIEKKLTRDMVAFEYGCGASTIWLSKYIKKIISVEHDQAWYEQIRKKLPANVSLVYKSLEDGYPSEIIKHHYKFDLISIDGRMRNECVLHALSCLTDGGVIIWDNAERDDYIDGYDHLTKNGFKRLDFYSMGPINTYSWMTSIFYRTNNCFNI